jgi:hypothetical protein
VKNIILLPFIFLLTLLVIFILITVTHVLYQVVVKHIEFSQVTGELIFSSFPESMLNALPASILLSFILLFFRMLKKPGNRFLAIILIVGAAFVILAGGMKLFTSLIPKGEAEIKKVENFLLPGRFYNTGEEIIYAGEIENNTLRKNLISVPEEKKPILAFYRNGIGRLRGNMLRLSFSGDRSRMITTRVESPYLKNLSTDFFTSELLSSYSAFVQEFKTLAASGSIEFLILCFAFSFFFMTSGVFMRISKWPLFNFCFMFFIITGVFFLYGLYQNIIIHELSKMMKGSTISSLVPAITMIILGVLLFLIDIIFLPAGFKKKEIESA